MSLQSQLAWDALGRSIQLNRLDSGLRESIAVSKQQLRSHADLARCSNEILAGQKQLQELSKAAAQLQGQQLQAQKAQLQAQCQQLQVQIQSLELQQQQHERNLEREKREAEENGILKIYVDLYSQALSLRQQGRYLDYVLVTLGAFRVYQQSYSDLDDANNRLKVTELKDRLYGDLRDVILKEQVQELLCESYREALREPARLVVELSVLRSNTAVWQNRVAELRTLQTDEATSRLAAMAGDLDSLKRATAELRQSFEGLTRSVPPEELFFPAASERVGHLVAGLDPSWNSWCGRAAETHGISIGVLRSESIGFLPTVQGLEEQSGISTGELARVSDALGLLRAAEMLRTVLPQVRERHAELRKALTQIAPEPDTSPTAIAAARTSLARLQRDAERSFGAFRGSLARNKHANSRKWLPTAQSRVLEAGIRRAETLDSIKDAFELDGVLGELSVQLAALTKRYQKMISLAAAVPATFSALEAELRHGLDSTQLARVDARVAAYRPGCVGKLIGLFKTASGKEADRRRVLADALVDESADTGAPTPDHPTLEAACSAVALPRLET